MARQTYRGVSPGDTEVLWLLIAELEKQGLAEAVPIAIENGHRNSGFTH
jgi:hypothetical protein